MRTLTILKQVSNKQLIKLLNLNLRLLTTIIISCVVAQATAEANAPAEQTPAPPSTIVESTAASKDLQEDTTKPAEAKTSTVVPPDAVKMDPATSTNAATETTATTPAPGTAQVAEPAKPAPKPVDLIAQLPNFKTTSAADLATKVTNGFDKCTATIATALQKPISWDNTLQPIIEQLAVIKGYWNLLIILNNVDQSGQTRSSLNDLVPKMATFHSNLMHNLELYKAITEIQNSADFTKLTPTQQAFIKQSLLDYKLYGADLTPMQQQNYARIITRLRELATNYSDNLSNSTNNWTYYVAPEDANKLEGIPAFIMQEAAAAAQEQNKTGWIFNLDPNNLVAVETFAKNRKLRETFYTAFATLASKQDPNVERRKWDNTPIVAETLDLRSDLAALLGYTNFAAYAIADRTPPDPAQALQFLMDLATQIKPVAEQEFTQLQGFAKMDKQQMQPWDVAFFAQWDKGLLAADSQEKSKAYFQIDYVLQGLFNLSSILFNTNIAVVADASTWDPAVKLYKISDVQNNILGYFYLDLYTRTNKAPTDTTLMYTSRLHASQNLLPVAVMCTNLAVKNDGLISHADLLHIFAQFGDMLQRVAATLDYPILSNTSGMTWDAIAQSSQFMQNWAWQKQFIQDISKHYQTGEKMPDELFDTLVKVNNFDAAINLLQQLELAIFDLRIHLNLPEDKDKSALEIYNDITEQFEVLPTIVTDDLPNRFTETFTTNIAATYFCFYWDKMVAADSFGAFIENGVFTAKIGHKYLDTLLAGGGQASILDLFTKFRGRPPEAKYLVQMLH